MSRERYIALGRYFAFAECTECKASLLLGKKPLDAFHEKVFPFVCSTLNGEADIGDRAHAEKHQMQWVDFWRHAAGLQNLYAYVLNKKQICKPEDYRKFCETYVSLKEDGKLGEFGTVKMLHGRIKQLDGIAECDYAQRMEHDRTGIRERITQYKKAESFIRRFLAGNS